ncbi:MAG: hypothetical protein BWX73_02565 [Lentisphaerae bacterium ADurb.Bin082]|nr:MAG: hypothetical protein BWX73_02565 [Lentisphaerae bacterium ADurb.Bin082]
MEKTKRDLRKKWQYPYLVDILMVVACLPAVRRGLGGQQGMALARWLEKPPKLRLTLWGNISWRQFLGFFTTHWRTPCFAFAVEALC